VKSYIFRVELEEEEDGAWSAIVPALPGCAASGDSVEEALDAVRGLAQAYVEVLVEQGQEIPVETVRSGENGAAVAVVTPPLSEPASVA
jgi:predicted RNase H-like HicB family nuclease